MASLYRCIARTIGIPLYMRTVNSTGSNLSAAATWRAIGFVAPETSTLNNVRIYCPSVIGAVSTSDYRMEVFSTTNSYTAAPIPNASVAGPYNCDSTPTSSSWLEWTPSYAVTRNTLYWLVWKNNDPSPATNYPVFAAALNLRTNTNHHESGWSATTFGATTSNSGSSWTTVTSTYGFRLGFSSGNFYGLPVAYTERSSSTHGVYSSRECGLKFTAPANAGLNVIGAILNVSNTRSGTPTGTPRLRLYSDTTLLGTADLVPHNFDSAAWFAEPSSPIAIAAGATVRIVLSETTQSDSSSNYYQCMQAVVDTDADSTGLIPLGAVQTYYNGSSWSDVSGQLIGGELILADIGDEFFSAGGSSNVRFPRTFTGF